MSYGGAMIRGDHQFPRHLLGVFVEALGRFVETRLIVVDQFLVAIVDEVVGEHEAFLLRKKACKYRVFYLNFSYENRNHNFP